MSTDPISNPGIPSVPQVPQPDRDKPMTGANEETQQRPFSLPPTAPDKVPAGATTPQTEKPSPMDVARQSEEEHNRMQWSQDEMRSHLYLLQDQFTNAQTKLQNTNARNLTTDHFNALNRLVDKLNPDMQAIAKNSQSEFTPPQKSKGEGVLSYVSKWIDGSQDTLSSALDYVNTVSKPDPASYLKLQFAVQRATQRGELFASIIGSSVSGIKTIMSTQLG